MSVTFPDGTAAFDLGAAAAKWADKIQHPPSRLKKIGATADWRVSAIGVTDQAFLKELEAAVTHLSIGRVVKGSDAIFFETTKAAELVRLEKLKLSLKPNGALWIIRPKGRPGDLRAGDDGRGKGGRARRRQGRRVSRRHIRRRSSSSPSRNALIPNPQSLTVRL